MKTGDAYPRRFTLTPFTTAKAMQTNLVVILNVQINLTKVIPDRLFLFFSLTLKPMMFDVHKLF